MAYVDIAFIAILIIAMGIGCMRGFFKSLASLFGTLVSLILAYFLTTLFVDKILGIGAINDWFYGESNSIASAIKGGIFSEPSELLAGLTVNEALSDSSLLGEALGGGLYNVFAPLILKMMTWLGGNEFGSALVIDCVSVLLARCVGWLIIFLVFFIILRIVASLISKLGNALHKVPLLGSLDRIFGVLIGGVKGVLFATVGLVILACCSGLSFMKPYVDDLNRSVIAKPITNAAIDFTGKFIDIESMTNGLLQLPEEKEQEQTSGGAALAD